MHKRKKIFFQTCWGWGKAQQKVKERWYERISRIIKGVYTISLCISRILSEKVSSTCKREIWNQNTPSNSPRASGTKWKFGQKGSIVRNHPKVWTSWAQFLPAKIRGKITWGDFAPRKMRPQSGMGFGEHIYKIKNADKATFYTLFEAKVMAAFTSKSAEEREFVVDSGASLHMLSKKKLEIRRIGYFAKIQNPYCGTYSQWRSAHNRGGTSLRSRSIRDCAIRRNVCCSIAWKTLRRPRIFLWAGHRSKTTVDQGKTSCAKRITLHLSLVVPGLSTSSGCTSSSSPALQDLSTYPAQERSDGLAPGDWCRSPSKTQKKRVDNWDSDARLRDLPEWLEEFSDYLEDTEVHAPAHKSQDSDSERPTKVLSKSRNHSFF